MYVMGNTQQPKQASYAAAVKQTPTYITIIIDGTGYIILVYIVCRRWRTNDACDVIIYIYIIDYNMRLPWYGAA